jgi:23S rRNA (guanosine2251-2'-O)-methyltransferase
VDETRLTQKSRELAYLAHQSERLGFPIVHVPPERLEDVTTGNTHGGIVAFCSDRTIPPLSDLEKDIPEDGFYAFLEGIEDPYNFGYALRSLYAAGIDGVVLPTRNWMTAAGVVARASAGTSERLRLWQASPAEIPAFFRAHGYRTVFAGIRDSVSLYEADLKKPLLLVIGGEKRGISRAVLDEADLTVRIDYRSDFHGSLSASAATAVLAFEVLRQNRV